MTAEMVEFLRAREAEREQDARAAAPGPWQYQDVDSVGGGRVCDPTVAIASLHYEQPGEVDPRIRRTVFAGEADATGAHIARHDPAWVLADVEAKRQVLALLELAERHLDETRRTAPEYRLVAAAEAPRDALLLALRLLALPYAGHPEFREEWRP